MTALFNLHPKGIVHLLVLHYYHSTNTLIDDDNIG